MKNNETILKYLSGLMDETEKTRFEKELENSSVLYDEYAKIKQHLGNLKNAGEAKVNSSYFNNLLPNVRERIERKKKYRYLRRTVYAVPALAALLVMFLMYSPNKNGDVSITDMVNDIVTKVDQNEVAGRYMNLNNDFSDYDLYQPANPFEVEIPSGWEKSAESYYLSNQVRYNDDYNLLENLSDKELEQVYNDLSKINI